VFRTVHSGRVRLKEAFMAVGIIFDGVGVSQDQYEQVFNEVVPNREPAPGLLTHHAVSTNGG
jgi:hypothetical protein